MKFLIFFFYFFSIGTILLFGMQNTIVWAEEAKSVTDVSEKEVFNKALAALQEERTEEASLLFLEFLKLKPFSEVGRFNLALSYWKSEKKGLALAYFRELLFENPYNQSSKIALKKLGDKQYLWLWLPVDLILAVIALSWGIFIFVLFKKRFSVLYLYIPVLLGFHCFSLWYFYCHSNDYATLIQDAVVLSAPDPKAPVLFEQKAGVFLKILPKKTSFPEWTPVQIPSLQQRGWLYSRFLQPLKRNMK